MLFYGGLRQVTIGNAQELGGAMYSELQKLCLLIDTPFGVGFSKIENHSIFCCDAGDMRLYSGLSL